MRNFTTEDFEGAGQYLVACRNTEPNGFTNTGFLSTIMYKIGYKHSSPELSLDVRRQTGSNNYCIVSMADGWTQDGYFITKDENGVKIEDTTKWKWVPFRGTDNKEEVVRVVLYQKSRWK